MSAPPPKIRLIDALVFVWHQVGACIRGCFNRGQLFPSPPPIYKVEEVGACIAGIVNAILTSVLLEDVRNGDINFSSPPPIFSYL